jgi:prepilin-type N-terminal cleavage/methylation domain-containing protein
MREKGFTLIEVMVAVAIVGFVTTMAYQFYIDTFQFQRLRADHKDMRVKLQLAMDILVSDIRATGFGTTDPRGERAGGTQIVSTLPGLPPLAGASNLIVPGNNVGVGTSSVLTDTIQTIGATQIVGTLAVPTAPGNLITVNPLVGAGNQQIVAGDVITIMGLLTAAVVNVNGNAITLGTVLQEVYPAGTSVYRVQPLLYGIGPSPIPGDNQPALLVTNRLTAIQTLVATGMEDLQVAYGLGTGVWVDTPTAGTPYFAVRVSLVARTPDVNPTYTGGIRPTLEDHLMGPADNFRRVALTRVVELSNDGFR